jgi:hypothetical protein
MPTAKKAAKPKFIRGGILEFTRNSRGQFLKIQIHPKIEELMSTPTTETSERYVDSKGRGIVHYKLKTSLSDYCYQYNRNINSEMKRVELNKFGADLQRNENGWMNLSILRAKGISEGLIVRVDGLVLEAEVKNWIVAMGDFVDYLFNSFVGTIEIKATIDIEPPVKVEKVKKKVKPTEVDLLTSIRIGESVIIGNEIADPIPYSDPIPY